MQNELEALYQPGYPPAEFQVQNQKMDTAYAPSAPSQTNVRPLLGPDNTLTVCCHCQATIKTAVKHTTTTRTHIAAVLCCLVCCCWCIPYCSNSAKNSDHYCPNCKKYLGTYEK